MPEAQLLGEDSYVPDPVDPRPAPRPIYKQTPASHKSDVLSSDGSERKSGDRTRRRKRIRAKETNISPAVLIGGGIAVLALLIGIGYAAVHFSGEAPAGPRPMIPADEGKSDKKDEKSEGPAIPNEQTVVDVPKTWSPNAPSFGYRILWPMPPGSLGYCPPEALIVGYDGATPIKWAYTERVSRIIMTVTVVDLLENVAMDPETVLDRHADKVKRELPPRTSVCVEPFTIFGQPARQISYVSEMERTVLRTTVKGNRLWTASIVCPQHVEAEDTRVVRFLNSFQPL